MQNYQNNMESVQIQNIGSPQSPVQLPITNIGNDGSRTQSNGPIGIPPKMSQQKEGFNVPNIKNSSVNQQFANIANMKHIKCVVVGDGAVGKTCMLMAYTPHGFSEEYVPTVFDNFSMKVGVNGEQYSFDLFDTAGQEDHERLRKFTYPNTDVFIICFSVDNKVSLENVVKWKTDVITMIQKAKIMLVACKCDQRQISGKTVISTDEGLRMAKNIGAICYKECSAKSGVGLAEVFNSAATIGSQTNSPEKKSRCASCIIL